MDDKAAEIIHILDEDTVDETGKGVFETPFTELIIHANVVLPRGEELHSGKVTGQTKYLDVNLIKTYDQNPLLNSMLYDVEFPDGTVK